MKNKFGTMMAVGVVLAGLGTSVQAIPITGQISFAGGAVLNANLPSATTFSFVTAFALPSPESSGTFAPANPSDPVTYYAPFKYTVEALPAHPEAWSIVFGGNTYSYYATGVTKDSYFVQGGLGFVNIGGTGYVELDNLLSTKTYGTWSATLTGQNNNPTPTFGATYIFPASVPDGGMTASLLGLGMIGCAFFGRRWVKLA